MTKKRAPAAAVAPEQSGVRGFIRVHMAVNDKSMIGHRWYRGAPYLIRASLVETITPVPDYAPCTLLYLNGFPHGFPIFEPMEKVEALLREALA